MTERPIPQSVRVWGLSESGPIVFTPMGEGVVHVSLTTALYIDEVSSAELVAALLDAEESKP